MNRVCRIDDDLLWFFYSLSPQQRLRFSEEITHMYIVLHEPFKKPQVLFFDTLEDYLRYKNKDEEIT
jgi:hypothetical protein